MAQPIQGVNLGGWLIAEKWLTPALFAGTGAGDEYALSRHAEGKKRIEHHRRTFIAEDDFAWLARCGIALVRIPVGYWLFEAADGYVPAVQHLDNALRWAETHGLQVLIDLHGARGSQNGFDNSGRAGQAAWFHNREYQAETVALLRRIAQRYRDSSSLWGIELLNEPLAKGHYFTLLRFYRRAYRALRTELRPGTHVVFHDGFQPLLLTGALRPRRGYPVAMDCHWYGFSFRTNDVQRYLDRSARLRRALLFIAQLFQPVIVGEWSTVLPQRFFDALPQDKHAGLLRRNAAMQQRAYRTAAGWMYWNYKAQGSGMWNFRSLVEDGTIKIAPGRPSEL